MQLTIPLRQDTKKRTLMYGHPAIQKIINKTWFRNKNDVGVTYPEYFKDGIALVMIALVVTAVCGYIYRCLMLIRQHLKIENCIDEWLTGEQVDIAFTGDRYREKFNAHLTALQNFEDETSADKVVPRIQKMMLKSARYVNLSSHVVHSFDVCQCPCEGDT
jgi:hypothetical protein